MIIKEKENIIFKFTIFVILFFLLSIIIVLRIVWIQTVGYQKYKNLIMKNNFRRITLKASRGNVYSIDNVLLATTIIRYNIYLDLKVINQKLFDKYIDLLSELLGFLFSKPKEVYKETLIQQKKKKSILFTC